MTETRRGFGKKDGSQEGKKQGGGRRNETTSCRHPVTKRKR